MAKKAKRKPFQWGLFSPKGLQSIAESNARLNVWEGAVRSSKTICSIVKWLEYIKTGPDGDYLMIGKTERTLKRNILDVIEQIVGKKHYHYNQGQGEITLYGRRIYVVGANDARSEGKIRGLTIAGAYGDELTLWAEELFKQMLARMSVIGAKFFGTTNPDSPYHWLMEEYINKPELSIRVFHFELEDNPNLSQEYIDNLKKEYTGLWYKRFILGLWVQAEGAVYDMWDEAKHVIDKWFKRVHMAVAIDYGTQNPCTFGMFEWTDSKGADVVMTKQYWYDGRTSNRQKTDGDYADDLIEWLDGRKPEFVIVDPSASSFIAELGKRKIRVIHAKNDVVNGIRFVGNMLKHGCFRVAKECRWALKEFSSYVWDAKAQKKGLDEPLKQNDHAMDMIRYFLYTTFGNFRPWSTSASFL